MSHLETGEVEVAARVGRPPAPGAESAGPPLTPLVEELRRTNTALEQLYRQARWEALERMQTGRAGGQTDGNGDAALKLFEVPQGCTGYLMLCALDEAGVTPAAPDTAATLWHAIYEGAGGDPTAAQVAAVGNMKDQSPSSPAADAQIPFTYSYPDRYGAPAVVGPRTFWLVIDGATASRQVAANWQVLVVGVEP